MINKEKLLLLATIYMLLPGAMPDALAQTDGQKAKGKKSPAVQKLHKGAQHKQKREPGSRKK